MPKRKTLVIGGIVIAVIVIGGISAALNPRGDELDPLESHASSPAATSLPSPAESSDPESVSDLAARTEAALLDALDVDSFVESGLNGRESPLYGIASIEDMYSGTIRVYYQEPLSEDDRDLIARNIFNLTEPTVEDLRTVVIQDTTGIDSNHYRP